MDITKVVTHTYHDSDLLNSSEISRYERIFLSLLLVPLLGES